MTRSADDKTPPHSVRNIWTETMRGAGLTGSGNVVIFAFDGHQRRLSDGPEIYEVSVPSEPSIPWLPLQKDILNILKENASQIDP